MINFFSKMFNEKNGQGLIFGLSLYGIFGLIVFVRYYRYFRTLLVEIRDFIVSIIDFILIVAFIFAIIIAILSVVLLAIFLIYWVNLKIKKYTIRLKHMYYIGSSISIIFILLLFLALFLFVFENHIPSNYFEIKFFDDK